MDLKGLVKSKTEGLGGAVQEKMAEGLDDLKKLQATLATFGLVVSKFNIEMSVVPQIHVAFSGTVDGIQVDRLEAAAAERPDDRLLNGLTKALSNFKRIYDHIDIKLRGLTVNLTLGVSPTIDIEVHQA